MKRVALSLIIFAIIATIVGCSPKGDPKETLQTYYSYIMDADYKAAYALLSEADKQATRRDDFILFMELNENLTKINKIEINQAEKNGDTTVFDVVENRHDYTEEKDNDTSIKRSVIAENGEWKVLAEGKYADMIADSQARIGYMFLNGIGGKKLDLEKAADWFSDALERDPSYYRANYGLAAAYTKLGEFDEAISAAEKYVEAAPDNNEKSDGMNVLGICYDSIGDREKAKEAFQKSVEYNPENESAKKNLSLFK